MKLCRIGLGCWGFGGDAYGDINFDSSLSIVQKAEELGVEYFDTAPSYGDGKCELILGQASKKDTSLIGTKVGMKSHNGVEIPFDFSEKGIRDSIAKSLHRLRRNSLDLVQLHSPPIEIVENTPNLVKIMDSIESEGLVKSWGISIAKPKDITFFHNYYSWKSIEFNFSLIDQRFFEFKDYFEGTKAKLIVRTPLNFGFLTEVSRTGKLIQDSNSHLSKWNISQIRRWEDASRVMKNLAHLWEYPLEILALRYILDIGFFDYVIPGAMSTIELEKNLSTYNFKPLNNDQVSKIYEEYNKIEKQLKLNSPFKTKV